MDSDLMFVVGAVAVGLAVPSMLASFSDNRAPRLASILLLMGGVLLVVALSRKPGGIALGEVPDIFVRVIARYLN